MTAESSTILSVNVGLPRDYGSAGGTVLLEKPWRSAIRKSPVTGPVRVSSTNLEGDAQADPREHGGPEMAVLAYSAEHYPVWRAELVRPDLPYGAFGENLTLSHLTEETICIGDTLATGSVRLQVSMPRGPCANLTRLWRIPDLVERVNDKGWGGWYLRVLLEGTLEVGSAVDVAERPYPEWTVAQAQRIRARRREDPETAAALAACPLLSESWRAKLLSSHR